MVTINLPEELAQQLEAIAQRENRPVEDVVAAMITKYEPEAESQQKKDAAFKAIFGIYDDDINDMSTTVSETLKQHFRDQDGRTD